jgi:hypothetical protein
MISSKLFKIIFLVIIASCPGVLLAAGSFSIAPAKVEVSLNPGQTVEREITVVNNLGRTSAFQVSVQDISPSSDENNPINLLGNDRGPYSLKNYVKPQLSDFVLRNGEAKTVAVTITIPKVAPPTGLYGAVTISAYAASSSNANVKIFSSLGALYFVKINGPVTEVGGLTDFRLRSGWLVIGDRQPVFEIIFHNEGNIYLNPYGFIGVKKWGRGIATKFEVKPWFVLPNSSRLREITATSTLSSGLYRADLFQNRGYNNVVDTKSIWFLKLSVWLASLLSIIILAIIYLFYRVIKNLFSTD